MKGRLYMSYMKLPHNHHNEIDNTELLEQLNDIQHFQIVYFGFYVIVRNVF